MAERYPFPYKIPPEEITLRVELEKGKGMKGYTPILGIVDEIGHINPAEEAEGLNPEIR